jgi:ParB-like chromosome segregation protein Spo0J
MSQDSKGGLVEVKIQSVGVGDRFRQDLGEIASLAKSIDSLGLLHPILIDGNGQLVCGQRRLVACKALGWDKIPARVVDLDALVAEYDENECRKDFSVNERVAIAKALEEREKPKAKERQQEGRRKGSETAGRGRKKDCDDSSQSNGHAARTRDMVAAAVGMAPATYSKAKAVVEAAEQEPELYRDLVEQMNTTGKVEPAYREMKRRKAGGNASEPKPEEGSPTPQPDYVITRVTTAPITPDDEEDAALLVDRMAAARDFLRRCQEAGDGNVPEYPTVEAAVLDLVWQEGNAREAEYVLEKRLKRSPGKKADKIAYSEDSGIVRRVCGLAESILRYFREEYCRLNPPRRRR